MTKVIIASRAKKTMKNEIGRFPMLETGGLLLGYSDPVTSYIQVLEATDSGYQNTVHEENVFEYDVAYVEHMCDILGGLYDPPLEIVGVWHKHNNACVTHFSRADEDMHQQLLALLPHPCLSILFEKKATSEEADDEYNVLVFKLNESGHEDVSESVEFSST